MSPVYGGYVALRYAREGSFVIAEEKYIISVYTYIIILKPVGTELVSKTDVETV